MLYIKFFGLFYHRVIVNRHFKKRKSHETFLYYTLLTGIKIIQI